MQAVMAFLLRSPSVKRETSFTFENICIFLVSMEKKKSKRLKIQKIRNQFFQNYNTEMIQGNKNNPQAQNFLVFKCFKGLQFFIIFAQDINIV